MDWAQLTELTGTQVAGFIAVVVALGVLVKVVAPVVLAAIRLLRRTGHFLDDWFGEPARGSQPARPGIPDRLDALQDEQKRVSRELQTNGGSTVKDAVKRIEAGQVEDRAKLDLLASLVGAFIGKEQESRLRGNEASAEAWKAIQAVHEAPPPVHHEE